MSIINIFLDLSCLLELSVLLTVVLIAVTGNMLILWSVHFT